MKQNNYLNDFQQFLFHTFYPLMNENENRLQTHSSFAKNELQRRAVQQLSARGTLAMLGAGVPKINNTNVKRKKS